MPAISFSDFDALPDTLAQDRFGILIEPQSQTGLNAVLAVRCQQIAVPEEMVEVMTVQIHGMEFNFRGRRTYDKSIGASFVETIDGALTTGMRKWTQDVVGSESGSGLNKKGYSTLGTLEVYDQSDNVALTYSLLNLWPSALPAVTLEGNTASPYVQQVTFCYDKFLSGGVTEQ